MPLVFGGGTKKLFHSIANAVRSFFTEEGDPVNLAVFRVVFYATLLAVYATGPSVVWFSELPADLKIPPIGLGWFLRILPISGTLATAVTVLFVASCCAGLVGLFSRTSAVSTLLAGMYILGIPEFYGKIDHTHHFLWFAAILAVSRSGDALSVDCLIAAWKHGRFTGLPVKPGPSRAYALPLRFVWLLLGIIYLFPGLWKVWHCGLAWALSDNIKYQMYSKWVELNGWRPFFRIDQYPLLYKLGGIGTLAFEISFIVLIFFKRLRPLALVGGVLFHESTDAFMHISFIGLYVFYLSFVDWGALFRSIGRRMFPQPMFVLYDGNCTLCKRTVGSLRAFDVLERLIYVNALDRGAIEAHRLGWLEEDALLKDMHVVVGERVFRGFASYRALAARIPFLWWTFPILWLWPVPLVGNAIYRRVADHRACDLLRPVPPRARGGARLGLVWTVGVFLVLTNSIFGFRGIISSWPFACYPTFSWIQGPEQEVLQMVAETADGKSVDLDLSGLTDRFTPPKFWWLIRQTLWWSNSEAQRQTRLRALWDVYCRVDTAGRRVRAVRFYVLTVRIAPEEMNRNPVRRDLVYEMNVDPSADVWSTKKLP